MFFYAAPLVGFLPAHGKPATVCHSAGTTPTRRSVRHWLPAELHLLHHILRHQGVGGHIVRLQPLIPTNTQAVLRRGAPFLLPELAPRGLAGVTVVDLASASPKRSVALPAEEVSTVAAVIRSQLEKPSKLWDSQCTASFSTYSI